jgi:hypothetical protein
MAKKVSDYYPDKTLIDDIGSIIVTRAINANSVDEHVYVAPFACRVVSIREIHSVAGGSAAAVRTRKITDTSAPGASAGATVKELSAAFDLTVTANTTQVATLTGTATPITNSDYYLAAGDKLALDFSGTLTNLVGMVTFHIKRI